LKGLDALKAATSDLRMRALGEDLVDHAYARYCGDLNGGRIMRLPLTRRGPGSV
jgi:heme oxygenase